MERKSLKDISWLVTEEEYRNDSSLSYSTLATYERSGFNGLDQLYDRKETPSLTFGSAVDAIITGGMEEFNSKFVVAEFPDIPDTIVKIVKDCFAEFHITHRKLTDIPDIEIIGRAANYNYQNNWKPETRAKVIKEKGADYYDLLFLAENKTILSNEVYLQVLASVQALKESPATEFYFRDNNPFDNTIERFYQLKFKATLGGIEYRCMADELIVDHEQKLIYPKDLKTSSHCEWDFYKSFIQWDYQIQARLYWRIIRQNLDNDPYFKDFTLKDYEFIVVNKETLTPLVWNFSLTQSKGTINIGKASNPIELKDPEEIGAELKGYLDNHPAVPNGIYINQSNDIVQWLNK